jgi:hypothetical protein
LKGSTNKVGGSFYCNGCSGLTSLQGLPTEISGDVYCDDNLRDNTFTADDYLTPLQKTDFKCSETSWILDNGESVPLSELSIANIRDFIDLSVNRGHYEACIALQQELISRLLKMNNMEDM